MAIRLPKPILKDAEIAEGATINIEIQKDAVGKCIILRPSSNREKLKEVLSGVTNNDIDYIGSGDLIGKEIWEYDVNL